MNFKTPVFRNRKIDFTQLVSKTDPNPFKPKPVDPYKNHYENHPVKNA